MGNGRSKEREASVTQRLRHRVLIAMHRFHHELQRGINEGPRLFRIEPFDQCRRPFEISQEGGDGLALRIRRLTLVSTLFQITSQLNNTFANSER